MNFAISLSGVKDQKEGSFTPLTLSRVDDLVTRIKLVIDKVRQTVPNNSKNVEMFKDSITLETAIDPVVTRCGHMFGRVSIGKWVRIRGTCPDCRVAIPSGSLYSLPRSLKNFVADLQGEFPIPTFSEVKGIDPRANKFLADTALSSAMTYSGGGFFEKAMESYKEAFKHTNASESYEGVPLLYEGLSSGEGRSKAVLANLHLALYQFQEGIAGREFDSSEEKVLKAINTLKHCKELDSTLQIDALLISFELVLKPSSRKLDEALHIARDQENPEEAAFIYKQVIACDPYKFEAYMALVPLLETAQEKKDLLLRAATCAEEVGNAPLAVVFRNKMEVIYEGPTSISQEDWSHPVEFLQKLPPYSVALQTFLTSRCPTWGAEGKTAQETHVVVPLFKKIKILEDGISREVPNTLENLDALDKASGGVGFQDLGVDFWNSGPDRASEELFEWMVMTKKVLPKSTNQNYAAQQRIARQYGYQVGSPWEIANGILFEAHRTEGVAGKLTLSGNERDVFWTRCNLLVRGNPSVVRGFSPRGLNSHDYVFDDKFVGVLGFLKFKAFDF